MVNNCKIALRQIERLINVSSSETDMRTIKVLNIEDNPGDARMVKELLTDDVIDNYTVQIAKNMNEVQQQTEPEKFDVILLDLSLPETSGLETVDAVKALFPHTPIVVLTGLDDEVLGDASINKGVQDYLQKGIITTPLLTRSIRYAIDRQKMALELEKFKQIENQDKELKSLEKLSPDGSAVVTEKALGIKSLKESSPLTFNEFTEKFEQVLKLHIENNLYKTDINTGNKLKALATGFGKINAGPKDIVEVYSTVLKSKIDHSNMKASQTYVDEGRFVLLEIMGYLVNYYRRYSIVYNQHEMSLEQ